MTSAVSDPWRRDEASGRRADRAAAPERTLAVGPTGMSISTCVDPARAFLDRMLATICPSLSKVQRPFDTDQQSSAGLRSSPPPQTMTAAFGFDHAAHAADSSAPAP